MLPAVLYFHPYEFYRGFLRLANLGLRGSLQQRHVKYVVLHNFLTGRISTRLRPLLRRFSWKPLGEIHRSWRSAPARTEER